MSVDATASFVMPRNLGELRSKNLPLDDIETLLLEFKEVEYINSEGLKGFIMWLKDIESRFPRLHLRFANVPSYLVRQLNSFKASMPQTVIVESMYVPYYCDSCDHEEHTLMLSEQAKSAVCLADLVSELHPCPKCESLMEADIIPEKYLSLLLERSKW